MGSEQCAGRNREILTALLTAVAEKAARTTGRICVKAATRGADRLALGFMPADFAERGFGFRFRHPKDLRQTERSGRFGLQEVDSHLP